MRFFTMGLVATVCGLIVLAVSPAVGHHSFDVEFDSGNTRDLVGVVTKIEWINPHAWLYLNVLEADGSVKNFGMELGPPYAIVRNNNECCGGWDTNTLKVGDRITIENVALARDGSPKAGATRDTWLILEGREEKLTLR
jgi:hypothetical protein